MRLDSSLRELRGVGPKRATRLAEAGLSTVGDLLHRLPFRHEDRRSFVRLADLAPGLGEVSMLVESSGARLLRTRRRGFTITEVRFRDDSGEVTALWYNQPYLARSFAVGSRHVLFGRAVERRNRRESHVLENPDHERHDPDEAGVHTGRIVPVYRRVAGLGSRALRTLVHRALEAIDPGSIDDPLPEALRGPDALPGRLESFRGVHFPPDGDPERLARRDSPYHLRLALDEMYLVQSALAAVGAERAERPGRRQDPAAPGRIPEIARELLPFAPTADQRRVIAEIGRDLAAPGPMARLLQGDVGTGKTAVAVVALARTAERGDQGVLLAPTEILAEQHTRTIQGLLERARFAATAVVLTGSVRGRERDQRLRAIASGEAAIVVGTHALLEEGVRFANLRTVVIDEQHRFGVAQRASLFAKGALPDVLVMTATPIPRTVALTVYGDLDLSVLRERPAGRGSVATLVRGPRARREVYAGVRREVERGRRAFVVVPRVEGAGAGEPPSAVEHAERLRREFLPGVRIGAVHGRMSGEAKDLALRSFAGGDLDVLVATTVIEVGVDVPEATVMVVEHADRFGLAQLHQLRGRVGRGPDPSWCVLLTGTDTPGDDARERLRVLEASDDGFEIAELDLLARGPGAMFATSQHGDSDLAFLAPILREPERLAAVRAAARTAITDDGERRRALARLPAPWRARLDLASIG